MNDTILKVQSLIEIFDRPIAFHRCFAMISGSTNAGIFLSQAWYWSKRISEDKTGWFYKTQAEWFEETCLSRTEQETARKHLRNLNILEEVQKGLPKKLYYRINIENLMCILISRTQECGKAALLSEALPPTKTKITTENTKEDCFSSHLEASDPLTPPIAVTPLSDNGVTSRDIVDAGDLDRNAEIASGGPISPPEATLTPPSRGKATLKGKDKASSKPKETWITPFCDVWFKLFGGKMIVDRALVPLKAMVDAYGTERAVAGWEKYCKLTGQFATASKFASQPSLWIPSVAAPSYKAVNAPGNDSFKHYMDM